MTTTKRTRKPKVKEYEFATYQMLEDLCENQHKYIKQRDQLMDRYRDSNQRLMEQNMQLQNRNMKLHRVNENQYENFKIIAREALLMWQEMESSGHHEEFLNEKISLNIEQLNKDFSNESTH